ncbi:PLP-dependent aminotransferase family protein [Rhizobium halophytocola]|uniref:GntR family transcriptional regulator/MocR family aminotransferase n=1 Tax=Rhizobium halophytocola TaxID=735519 RepID=A0ABS4DZU7_9HYPH|nr:PLP-dependent aminotransferase family protein [Rhizobium halophytocola]MBP1851208.1 GntR family transcriptional regulator/MocR family aminotransferase [Rhizobium halophytocola]
MALYGELKRLIEAGRLKPGTKLPTTRDLSARLTLSRGAVVAAYDQLVAEGYAEARTGDGTYVAADVPALAGAALANEPPPCEPPPPLPGTLGCTTADEMTIRTFRTLLNRHLTQPTARHYFYQDPRGGADLRTEIAAYLRTARGVRCRADQVILTSGTQQALDLVIRTLTAPGDTVAIEDPCYGMAREAFEAAQLRVLPVPVDAEGLDVGALAAAGSPPNAVYVTPSHQFPLGVTLTMARRLALIDWAERHQAHVIEDDYDSEFRFAGPPLTALQGVDGAGRVIYVGSFSKTLMPGFRIGYLVAPEPLLEPLLAMRRVSDRFPSTLLESALAEFLRDGHFAGHLKRARRRVRAARDALVAVLASHGFSLVVPEQGLHLVARLPGGPSEAEMLAAASDSGFAVRALSPLYAPPQTAQPGVVIGFSGFPADVLAAAASRWAIHLRRP